MKLKNSLLLAILSWCVVSTVATASTLITYSPIKLNHGSDYLFDLKKGNPQGMRDSTLYKLTCQTSATADSALSITPCGSSQCARWSSISIDGNNIMSNQFKLPTNAKFTIDNLSFVQLAFGTLTLANLDNEVDVTLNCYAEPVL